MKKLIWDLPTRIFHWLFVLAVMGAFLIAQITEKESPQFYFHVIFGVLAGLLIIWRFFWGFIGSKHIRWDQFFFKPAEIFNYFLDSLRGKGRYYVGHNPGGAFISFVLIILTVFIIITGMASATDEIFEELHENLPFLLMGLIGLHVIGVLIASQKHQVNYILAMFTGKKKAGGEDQIESSFFISTIIMLVLVFSAWFYFIAGFDREKAIFIAPGTQWKFQVGEPEYTDNGLNEIESEEDEGDSLLNEDN